MDRLWLLFPCALVAECVYLNNAIGTSFALERPLHTAGVLLFLCGITVIAQDRLLQLRSSRTRKLHKDRYTTIPLSHGDEAVLPQEILATGSDGAQRVPLGLRALAGLALLLLLAVCGRIAVFHYTMKSVECTGHSPAAFLLLALALFHGRRDIRDLIFQSKAAAFEAPQSMHYALFRASTRYILPAWLLSTASFLVTTRGPWVRTTFICPMATGEARLTPKLQLLGFFLDCVCLIVFYVLVEDPGRRLDGKSERNTSSRGVVVVGFVIVMSALVLAVAGTIIYTVMPEHREWMMATPSEYLGGLMRLSLAIPCTIICFFITFRFLGIMAAMFIAFFTFAYAGALRALSLNVSSSFPPKSTTELIVYLIWINISIVLYILTEFPEGRVRPRMSCRLQRYHAILVAAILATVCFMAYRYRPGFLTKNSSDHPIANLIRLADEQHSVWALQAQRSRTLKDAVQSYQERYSHNPPPGFDKWYEFAMKRHSVIIDEFDNINKDLAPFSSLSPNELRQRTARILADGNGVGGIRIRDGKGDIVGNVPGTHRWMMDGTLQMIEKFAEFLPDMDLAISLNDECRVAVSYDQLQSALDHRERYEAQKTSESTPSFSPSRAATWPILSAIPPQPSYFRGVGSSASYRTFGSVACPATSKARTENHWDKGVLCASCTTPHSMGIFVSNWSISADPCHQPDLADLHGLHVSPLALWGTHELIPIFSQSRAPGYVDIRYPSPWNYMDKAVYAVDDQHPDPKFHDKENTLFWRGMTTEGVSPGNGVWKGMMRQRLVHLVNNETNPQTILLRAGAKKWEYMYEDPGKIKNLLAANMDVRFVNHIAKCGGHDCTDQEREFGFGNSVDFEHHWRYKYLFDVDGAGFSGRFIPFLQSNSVVLKSALFREWHEGRLTAWKHFIPVDLRLHDLWSIMAYFAGYGLEGGGQRRMVGHEKDARKIAKEGREWAEKVLRKEDMEIYMFRLLLEWGRLTDERREYLGFKGVRPKDERGVVWEG
ncbi:glycosyltransferase family 90 protein [Amniculicola lignicola CBS 123094]|uniref:Glycosyltransferase family 90 protein n=1 Tax=Amniculicola lignicola CBS 123094 TaxID=1392246 RepID=A0A6A5WBL3_9PLEO|nr:glycosyltransferase family 90 protein [Amniculicola lignicola CBS 123094]